MVVFCCFKYSSEASVLLSSQTGVQKDGTTLVVLRFDEPLALMISESEGREISLLGTNISVSQDFKMEVKGNLKNIRVASDEVVIQAKRYVKARLIPSGAGKFILQMTPAKEPPAGQRKRSTANSDNRQTSEANIEEQTAVNDQSRFKDGIDRVDELTQIPTDYYQSVQVRRDDGTDLELPITILLAKQIIDSGDDERASTLLNSIKIEDEEYGWSRILLANIAANEGDTTAEIKFLVDALDDISTLELAAVRLALIYKSLDDTGSASDMWEKLLSANGGIIYLLPDTTISPVIMADTKSGKEIDTSNQSLNKPSNIVKKVLLGIGTLILLAGIGYGGFILIRKQIKQSKELNKIFDDDFEDMEEDGIPQVGKRVAGMYKDNAMGDDAPLDFPDDDGSLDDFVLPGGDEGIEARPEDSEEDKQRKIEELNRAGASVLEIAETLNIGQDEVRMAISMADIQ